MTCGSDKSVKLWSYRKGLLLKTYSGHRYEVLDVAASSDSSTIISAGMDKVALIWDVTAAQVTRALRGHSGQINAVKYNKESSIAITASFDGTVRMWDLKSKSRDPVQILDEAKDSVSSLSATDYEVVTGSLDGKVRKYDIRQGMLHIDDVQAPVSSVCFTGDTQCILTNCLNDAVYLIDKDSGDVLQIFKGHQNSTYRIDGSLTKNDAIVLSGSEDGYVYCWSLTEVHFPFHCVCLNIFLFQATLVEKLCHPRHRVVHSVSCHPKQNGFLTAAEGHIYLWDEAVEEDGDD